MRSYVAEIISVGTELLLGNIVNTNAQYLAEMLSLYGINVYYQTVVGDNPARLKAAVEIAAGRSDILIMTGGLGPTSDDLTKETVAACFGRKLVYHTEVEKKLREMFVHHGRITPNNFRQAMLPEGCTVLENICGTAPGCAFESDGKLVVMLPGPPRECIAMFENAVRPILEKLSGGCIVSRSIRIFGMGESAVEDALHDLILGSTNPSVAPYAKTGEVMLRVTALADTKDEAFDMTLPVIDEITNTLPDCIYGVDCDSLEERAYSLLSERNVTLASAESCTGGLLAKRITDIPGSSGVFLGGVVPYSNEMKEAVLGIPREIIVEHGAVSEQTARMMADGVRGLSGADFGIGITGIAGPGGGSDEKPVGLVYVALAARDGTYCRKMMMGTYGGRDMIRARSVNTALDMLIRHLTGRPVIANMY